MAKLTLDLTGVGGLTNRYYGDKPYDSSKPNHRYFGAEGEVAEGIYNPISHLGFMSPANATTKDVTGTTSYLLSSALIVDSRLVTETTDAIFFADETETGTDGQIVNLDTAIDTSLDATTTIASVLNPDPTYRTNFSAAVDSAITNTIIRPEGTTIPTLQKVDRDTTGSGTDSSSSITVPSGLTNPCAYVLVMNHSGNDMTLPTATFGGNAMTHTAAGSTLNSGYYNLFYYQTPSAGSNAVVVTYPSSETSIVMYTFVTDNTKTTGSGLGLTNTSSDSSTTYNEANTENNTYDNTLRLAFTYSETATHTFPLEFNTQAEYPGTTTKIGSTNDFGTDSMSFFNKPDQFYKVEDMIKYQINGVPKIFFIKKSVSTITSYNSIGIADIDFSDIDDNWSDETPSGADMSLLSNDARSSFVFGDNGLLYVLDGNHIHEIDGTVTGGTTGTITSNQFELLGTSNDSITRFIDGVDIRAKMWIGTHLTGSYNPDKNSLSGKVFKQNVVVYVWDKRSSALSAQDFIPISGAREYISTHILQGQVSCFTISKDGYTQFRMWNGNEFKVVKKLNKNAYPKFRRHSVHEDGETITWIGNDGKMYIYGKVEEGMKNALYIIGDMTEHITANETFSGGGILLAANATETVTSGRNENGLGYYVSFKDTAGNHLKKWYPHGIDIIASNAQLANKGNVFSLVKYLPDLSTVHSVDIRCLPTGTGTGTIATVKYYFNQSDTAFASKIITKNDASKGYITHKLDKPYVNSVQIEIEWSTSETTGVDFFRPSIAIIDYEPTGTKKGD